MALAIAIRQRNLDQPRHGDEHGQFQSRLGIGLGAGLVFGLGLALWLELRDKSIRNEADVEASLQMPVLVSLPWVTEEVEKNGNGKFWNRDKAADAAKEKVGV